MNKLFKSNHLVRIVSAQSVSMYANQVISFVIPWLILTRTGSVAIAGMVVFAMAAASVVGALAGGIITDHIGGRKVSLIADLLSLLTTLVLALTLFGDVFSLWLVIVSQVLGVFFDGPGTIAKNTLVPAAATQDQVPVERAMGVQQTLQQVAMFVGPLSAGFLIAVLTESVTLMLASALFLVCVLLVGSMRRQNIQHEHPLTVERMVSDMREAIHFLRNEPFLGPMQLFGPSIGFFVVPISSLILPAWYVFAGQSASTLGVFLGVQALGGMVGGIAYAVAAPKVSQHAWLIGATMAYTLALFGLYFLELGSIAATTVGFLGGVASTSIMAILFTAFYTWTPERLLGRVNSVGSTIGSLSAALAALCFGWVVHATSARTGLLVCAVGMGTLALGTLCLPFMKLLDQKQEARIDVAQAELSTN